MKSPLTMTQIEALAALSTPTVCNAIETFNLRLRNEGYMDGTVLNRSPKLQPMVGYAITVQMRTEKPPVKGFSYPDRNDWWELVQSAPSPKIIVIEDTDKQPGTGSVAGEIHGSIFKALGCTGIVTNGAVRDLEALDAMHMHIYSGSLSPSHAYAHIADIGKRIEVGGMTVENGDLLHGDQHGIVKIPHTIAPDIYITALNILNRERNILQFCNSAEFSVSKLREIVNSLRDTSLGG